MSVDLPTPLGPSRITSSPPLKEKLDDCKICWPLRRQERWLTASSGIAAPPLYHDPNKDRRAKKGRHDAKIEFIISGHNPYTDISDYQ